MYASLPRPGPVTSDQAFPFQRMMSSRYTADMVPQRDMQASPTAQAVRPGPPLTPSRSASRPGLGLAVRDQDRPSQRKISVRSASDDVPQADAQVSPAAQALPSGAALTPCSSAAPPRLGLVACDQVAPLQCTISARPEVVEPAAQALPSGPALTPISCPAMGLNGSCWPGVADGCTGTPGAGAPQAARPPRPASSATAPAAATARRRRGRPAHGAAVSLRRRSGSPPSLAGDSPLI